MPVTGSRIVLLGLVAACFVTLSAFSPAERGADRLPSVQPTSADTLRYDVPAGDPLILALPARVNGEEATYHVMDAPALSWLVDHSFFYQTVRGERGELAIRFRRTTASGTQDPVVLLVTITA
ncbi:MAG: hypothetical protein Rubg2KO_20440 [Rubricoccaceae bacterium]